MTLNNSESLVAIGIKIVELLQYVLNIDQKIPLTYRISCIRGIIGYAPVSLSKQNAGISSTEVSRKLRGWHARQDTCPRVTCRREV